MAITNELEFLTTASLNTTLGGSITLDGAVMTPSQVDDAFRQQMAYRAAAITRQVAKAAGAYTALKADHNQFWRCTGAVTINLTAAATLTDGWCLWVRANGGAVTIDPNAAELIDGAATLVLADGSHALIICTGTAFFTEFNTSVLNGTLGTATPSAAAVTTFTASGTAIFTGALFGLAISNNVADATNDIDIATGWARDATDVDSMVLASALTKRLDALWVVGTNQGGLDAGAVANGTYHVFVIKRPDTGVVDVIFSLSATTPDPTRIGPYTRWRRIGSVLREGATIIRFLQDGDYFWRETPVQDINTTNPGTAAVTRTLSTPVGVKNLALILAGGAAASGYWNGLMSSLDVADIAPSTTVLNCHGGQTGAINGMVPVTVRTNASSQIRSRISVSGASNTLLIQTLGWIDKRGREY